MYWDALFEWLGRAPLGAFALSMDQTIVLWNARAGEILGYPADLVVGRKCYEVLSCSEGGGITTECSGGCAVLRYVRSGVVPASLEMVMRCATGVRKIVSVRPVVVSQSGQVGPFVVYLFDDGEEEPGGGLWAHWSSVEGRLGAMLTVRELEVLRYVALGWEIANIALELGVSGNIARRHSLSLRRKLGARSRVEVVLAAVRFGLLKAEDFEVE